MNKGFVNVYPDTMPGDEDLCYALHASAGHGGITITRATVATGAVGTFNLELLNYGTAGTALQASGTIAAMADGTATVWAADTPQTLTVVAAQAFVDENEYVVLRKTESAAGNDLTADAVVMIEYVDGVVTVG